MASMRMRLVFSFCFVDLLLIVLVVISGYLLLGFTPHGGRRTCYLVVVVAGGVVAFGQGGCVEQLGGVVWAEVFGRRGGVVWRRLGRRIGWSGGPFNTACVPVPHTQIPMHFQVKRD